MQENTNGTRTNETTAAYRPRLAFYHANAKGTGCAVQLSLHPAHGCVEGSIRIHLANQKTVGRWSGGTPQFATFDWENEIVATLGFTDLAKCLQVFRGECESIDGDHGLYHRTAKGMTNITLRHLVEPTPGYVLTVSFKPTDAEEARAQTFFTPAEALGLCEAISASMMYVGFGVPNAPQE